jgi:glycosyltransferase involved in cell wall biosynthesis
LSANPPVTVGIPTYNRSAWLRETIESVLAQTFQDFRILVSDNGSTDDTADVVRGFGDERIDYRPLERGVGMTGNFNRIFDLTETDYLVVLPDDDLLRPDHLESTLDVMKSDETLGVVHTGFDTIDETGRVLNTTRLVGKGSGVSFETRRRVLWRGMYTSFLVCWSSALFRAQAARQAGGMRDEQQPLADFALFMRIALDWNFASIGAPLAAIRMHGDAATVREGYGRFGEGEYEAADDLYRGLHEVRRDYLEEFRGRFDRRSWHRHAARADRTYQRDQIGLLRTRASHRSRRSVGHELAGLIRGCPRNVIEPVTWRLILTGFWR